MISAKQAIDRLRAGNLRFVSDDHASDADTHSALRRKLAAGQKPFAIVLGCSDSRVPIELVFDEGLGELFVIRVAGNIVASSQIGSVEFAADHFGSKLVVVLGHTKCGAVTATLDAISQPAAVASPNLHSIVDRIRPSVEALLASNEEMDAETTVDRAVRANVRASAEQLRHGSPILEKLMAEEGLVVVGAEYSLETGLVDFFDGVPDAD